MKHFLSLSIVVLISFSANAQTGTSTQYYSPTSLQNNFNDMLRATGTSRLVMTTGIQTFSGETRGSRYFYPSFADGSVTTLAGETLTKRYQFLFDKITQQVYLINASDSQKPDAPIFLGQKD